MVFIADDLAAWLVGLFADAGSKRVATLVLGPDQQRALRRAAKAAIQLTARELCPEDDRRAEDLAMVLSEVSVEPKPGVPPAGQETVLEELQVAIAKHLAVLDDAALTGTGQSSADLLGVPGRVIAEKLTAHMVRQIIIRGSHGGPLVPLASQLNDDKTHLQGQQIEDMVGEVLEVLARADDSRTSAVPIALAQLPPLPPGFTGREDELAILLELLAPGGPAKASVSALAGLAGMGKTALAVVAGHLACQRGWFRGGVLFLDLHGYDEVPVEPGQSLDTLLRALGLHHERIPPSVEERAGLYRSVLAQIADPVLVIADNASSEAQVRFLVPGEGPHKVLVTSRNTLAALGGALVDIAALDNDASVELLDRALRAARPGDDRISLNRGPAGDLAEVCGGLPLALQITAALLKADEALTVGELGDELDTESARLEKLAYDDGSGTRGWSVAAAFELSYGKLESMSQQLFRLLSLNPGSDVSTAAAAVLMDLPVARTRDMLGRLLRAHLVEAVTCGANVRWRMHDLLRLYAQRLSNAFAASDLRESARDRMLGYYLDMAQAADHHVRALPGMMVPEEFTDPDAALTWLDAEWPNLVAATQMAAGTDRVDSALRFPLALGEYFDLRRRFDDWLVTSTIGVQAARRLGDRQAEGAALSNFGRALYALREFKASVAAHLDVAAICRETGDIHGEGTAMTNVSQSLQGLRKFKEAALAAQVAVTIYRQTGDRRWEGEALANLSNALRYEGQFADAITASQEAVKILHEIGDWHREGMALGNLGLGLRNLGLIDLAISAHQDALAIFRASRDQHSEATELVNVGLAFRESQRLEEAITAFRHAVAIFSEIDDMYGWGLALSGLGVTLRDVQQFEEAIAVCRDASKIFRDIGDWYGEASTLHNLGLALKDARRFQEAIAAFRSAAVIFRENGDKKTVNEALVQLRAALSAWSADQS